MSCIILSSARSSQKQRSQYDSSPPSEWRGVGGELVTKTFGKVAEMYLRSGRHPITKAGELPEVKAIISQGTLDSVLITHVVSPEEFYVVLKRKVDYSLDHPEWTRFFPPFNNGFEALNGITTLLTMYYTLSPKTRFSIGDEYQYQFGDLVGVKMQLKGEKVVRRGLIFGRTNEVLEEKTGKTSIYHQVYLIDCGYHVDALRGVLFPLPKPFIYIGALAVKATLFGISPIGERWDSHVIKYFTDQLQFHHTQNSIFFIEVMSRPTASELILNDSAILVTLKARESITSDKDGVESTQTYVVNFTEELIEGDCGIPWNLFPSRPKLMEGTRFPTKPATSHGAVGAKAHAPLPFPDDLLLTPYPPACDVTLSKEVLERDVARLFRLRKHHFEDVKGMENRLLTVIKLDNPNLLQAYQTPTTIVKCSGESKGMRRAEFSESGSSDKTEGGSELEDDEGVENVNNFADPKQAEEVKRTGGERSFKKATEFKPLTEAQQLELEKKMTDQLEAFMKG